VSFPRFSVLFIVVASAITALQLLSAEGTPRIQFATRTHDFGKAKAGEVLRFTFKFTNQGSGALELTAVRPGCGCTTTGDWTKKVAPGGMGVIPVEVRVGPDWPGGPITKSVVVESDDETEPVITLELSCNVWKEIEVLPQYAVLNITADETMPVSTNIGLTNNIGNRIAIWDPQISDHRFSATLKTNTVGKDFALTVTIAPPFIAGELQGTVHLKTSVAELADLLVPVAANIQPVIVTIPPQITLPPPPLGARATPRVLIQNNSTNSMSLSEPLVNAKGVIAQLTETQPGHSFSLKLAFPQDFQIKSGEKVTLRVKTSNSRIPELIVPISQMGR